MTQLVALDSQTHRDLRVATWPAAEARVDVVSVVPREFPRLLAHYPIFFARTPATGRFEPAVLLGFQPGENLFLTERQWDVEYVPLQMQRQPFSLMERRAVQPGGQPGLDVALDLSNPRVQRQEGERLYLDDGKPSQMLQTIASILRALIEGSQEAYAFTGKLAELGLIEPVRIDVKFVDESEKRIEGVYWIAAAALKALPAAQLAELRDLGYLEWLYFQMASLSHMSGLVARKNRVLSGLGAKPAS